MKQSQAIVKSSKREFTDDERHRGQLVISQARQAAATVRALQIATAVVFEKKSDKQIAEELGISRESLWNWKSRHRELLDATFEAAIAEVKEIQAGAALKLRLALAEQVDEAVKVLHDVLRGTGDTPARDNVRLKAAIKLIDYLDPTPDEAVPAVSSPTFSPKATELLLAVASQDMTPRRPITQTVPVDKGGQPGTEDDEER
jgi:hypothetical protein